MRWPPYIRSLNGMKITFLDLKREQIQVNTILLHLAKACRYNGMVDGWYSNAEHSYLASYRGSNRFTERALLVHDFGEFITNDVPGPVKTQCPDYAKLCKEVQDFMYFHFLGTSIIPDEVKQVDLRLYATEQYKLRTSEPEDYEGIKPYDDVLFRKWEWREAHTKIKARFHQLFPEYQDAV